MTKGKTRKDLEFKPHKDDKPWMDTGCYYFISKITKLNAAGKQSMESEMESDDIISSDDTVDTSNPKELNKIVLSIAEGIKKEPHEELYQGEGRNARDDSGGASIVKIYKPGVGVSAHDDSMDELAQETAQSESLKEMPEETNMPVLRYLKSASDVALDEKIIKCLSSYVVTDNKCKFLPHIIHTVDATGACRIFIAMNKGRIMVVDIMPVTNISDEVSKPSFDFELYCNIMIDELAHFMYADTTRTGNNVMDGIIKGRFNDNIKVSISPSADFLGFYPFDATSFVERCLSSLNAYATVIPSDAPYFNPYKWMGDVIGVLTPINLEFDSSGVLDEVQIINKHGQQNHTVLPVEGMDAYKCHGVIINGAPTLKEVYGTKTKTDKEGTGIRW